MAAFFLGSGILVEWKRALFLFFFVILYLALVLLGNVNLSSAVQNSRFVVLESQQRQWSAVGILLALLGPFVLRRVPFVQMVPFAFVGVVGLLVLVLPFGESIGGSTRWFSLPGFSLQPSELAKPLMVFLLPLVFEKTTAREVAHALNLLFTAIVAILVFLEPDLGTAIVFFVLFLVHFFLTAKNWKRLLLAFSLLVLCAVLLYSFALKPHQKDRLSAFFDPVANPETYYQTRQSITMVGSGALVGRGYRQGPGNLFGFLPADHTDFVLAVFGEEFGFVGLCCFFGLWGIFLGLILRLALRADAFFRQILAGIFALFFFQVFYNAAMVLGLVPVTGLPLPFFTYGGSSMVSNSFLVSVCIYCIGFGEAEAKSGKQARARTSVRG